MVSFLWIAVLARKCGQVLTKLSKSSHLTHLVTFSHKQPSDSFRATATQP